MSTGLDRHTAEASRNMDAVLSGIIGTSPQQLASHLSGGGASAEAGENASAAVHPFASLVAGLDLIKGAICGGSFDQNTFGGGIAASGQAVQRTGSLVLGG